jgi:hypothetical protein
LFLIPVLKGLAAVFFQNEQLFCQGFLHLLADYAQYRIPEWTNWLKEASKDTISLLQLSEVITALMGKTEKQVVLLIDEVDKSSNNQLFIDFLALLRNKYLAQDLAKTFHSVILAGVHDVKSIKLKLRPEDEQKFNSPWNIATEFRVDMNLQPVEIVPMLREYARDCGVHLDAELIAKQLFYYTSGYPFLVSKLCKTIDEQILPTKTEQIWSSEDIEVAASMIVRETNTNFDALIKNLENNPALYNLAYKSLIEIEFQSYSIHDPTVSLGLMYGIIKNGEGISIHNRIYEEIIYAYITSKATSQVLLGEYNVPRGFRLPDNRLNIEAILLKFQAFMKEHYSAKDRDFLERNGRLVFLAFIKPIINGSGYDFKEPQISEERRLDVVITYFQHKYIVELKIWRGAEAHADGMDQLTDYLNQLSLSVGYLLIFDHSKKKSWKSSWVTVQGKNVFVVWV